MHVSQERIMERIEALARFNATPGAGVSRSPGQPRHSLV